MGQEEGISLYGRSFCADPLGEMASDLAGGKEAIVIADIDLAAARRCRDLGIFETPQARQYGSLVE